MTETLNDNSLNRNYEHLSHHENDVAQLKQDLENWKVILLPLNNLLEWEHKFDPLIICTLVSFIFGVIAYWSPSVLTTVSLIGIIMLAVDFIVPIVTQNFFKTTQWNTVSESKYTRICERISNFYNHAVNLKTKLITLRKEKQSLYSLVVLFALIFCMYVGQLIDNLLLTYLAVLIGCLLPGARRHNLPQKAFNFITSFYKQQTSKLNANKKSS